MATDFFLVLDGIKGESQDSKHKDQSEIISWSCGASQSGTTHSGTGSGGGKCAVHDLSLTKYTDKSSPVLWQHCLTGKHIKKGKLICRKAGEKPLEYLTIELEDIMISNVSQGGHGGEDRLTESISLNFGQFHQKYAQQNADGSKGAEVEHKYNIAQNKQM